MEINKYPDGSSYVTIPEEWREQHQKLTFRVNTYEDFWHLVQLCEVLTYNSCTAEITIPNLLGAQADRRFAVNQSSDLYKMAEVLNKFGDDIHFNIFHPHNSEVVEALFDHVTIIDNEDFIFNEVVSKYLGGKHNSLGHAQKNLVLMSADAGGFKPLMRICDMPSCMGEWTGETYSAAKSRVRTPEGESKITQIVDREDFFGKDILIVDDISVYGGTFKGLSKLLRQRNCGKLYLAVSHMTVQNLGEDPITNYFDKVFTTNSKFDKYYFEAGEDRLCNYHIPNLEIIKLF